MRIVIIDPFLRNISGHEYNYAIALKSGLDKKGIKSFILGNEKADPICLEINGFIPCLTEIVSKVFDVTYSLTNLIRIFSSIFLLQKQLTDNILNNINYKIEDNDVLFVHSLYVFELISLALFIRQNRKILIEKKCKIISGFNFRYVRNSKVMTVILALLYKFACSLLISSTKVNVIYFSDGELLKQEYEKLIGKKFKQFPYPLASLIPEKYRTRVYPDDGKIVISCLGATRWNKGFDIFVKMVEELVTETEIMSKIKFVVQVYIQKQPKPDMDNLQIYVDKLGNIATKIPNLKIYNGSLEVNKYYELLSVSNIMVLPYRDESFKICPSSVFNEALMIGTIPVVPSNTSMAHDLKNIGLNELIFEKENVMDLVKVIKYAVNNCSKLNTKFLPIQKKWAEHHSAENLVECILNC